MKGFQITNNQITPMGEITLKEAVEMSFTALDTFLKQMVKSYEVQGKSEEEIKELKVELHDIVVINCSLIADSLVPQDEMPNSLTPEELLEKLEKAAKDDLSRQEQN